MTEPRDRGERRADERDASVDDEIDELLDDGRPLSSEELAAIAAEDDDLKQTLSALGDEEADPPAPVFTHRVMADVGTRRRAWYKRAADTVVRPRILRFSVATAVPLLAIAAIAVAVALDDRRGDDAPTPDRTVEPTPAPPLEPADDDVIASFSLAAPDAESVAVAGDFNGWNTTSTALTDHDGDGVWTAVVPLRPGRYAYMFIVDGRDWILDPDAKARVPDGFGGTNGILRL